MKSLLLKLYNSYPLLFVRLNRRLPTGMTEYKNFVDRIILLSGNFADRTSMEFAIASILIHADAKFGALPDKFFVDRLIKSAANQVASQVFQDIKNQQAARQAAPQSEATASLEATPSDAQNS